MHVYVTVNDSYLSFPKHNGGCTINNKHTVKDSYKIYMTLLFFTELHKHTSTISHHLSACNTIQPTSLIT